MIAFLGTGLLGSGFVRAAIGRGENVQVWNRTHEKAQALEPAGARAYRDPTDAVRGARCVHITLYDDAAVDDVLEQARDAFTPGLWLIDHTTTSPQGARERTERWCARGFRFVHAPVFMGPQNAVEATGVMLVSGERSRVDDVLPELEPMTGKVHFVGESPERAAALKLVGNMFLMFLTSGLADVFAFAKACDVAPSDAASLFEFWNPGETIGARAARMIKADYDKTSWALSMARKDARLITERTSEAGIPLAVLPAITERMDELIAAGFGECDWTVLAKDALATGEVSRSSG